MKTRYGVNHRRFRINLAMCAAGVAAFSFAAENGFAQTADPAPAQTQAQAQTQTQAQTKARSKARVTRESEAGATHIDLPLAVGVVTTLDLKFRPGGPDTQPDIQIANTGLVAVQWKPDKYQLLFTPIKKGETNIVIRDEHEDIRMILHAIILDTNLGRRLAELRELLKDVEGIDMRIMGDKIVIDGEVVVFSDLNRLYNIIGDKAYQEWVMNLVTISPVGLDILAKKIQEEINDQGVRVRVQNGFFLLEGQVESADKKNAAENIARELIMGVAIPNFEKESVRAPITVLRTPQKLINPVINRIAVAPAKPKPPEKMVRLTVDFVELSKEYLRDFGFMWAPTLDTGGSLSFGQSTTGGVTSQGNGSLSGTIGNLFPRLNAAQNAGYGRILEESVMLAKTGEAIEMKRELEIPVQITSARGESDFRVQKIGPVMKMTPRIMTGTEEVDLKISFSYAGIAGQQGNALQILNHTFATAIVVHNGESAAIINAISNVVNTNFNKRPPVTNPLFTLLRSKAFQKNKSQFVVFITPQIVENASTGTTDIQQKYGLKKKL